MTSKGLDSEFERTTTTKRALQRQALFALGWSSVGTGAVFASNTAALLVLSRMIDPDDFGVIAAATSVGLLLKGIGPLAITQATLQLGDRLGIARAGTNVAWLAAIAFSVLLYLLATPLGDLLNIEGSTWVLRAWVPILLCQGAAVPAQVVLQGALRFKEITGVQTVAALLGSSAVPIVLALFGLGVRALYFALLFQAIIELAGLILCSRCLPIPGRAKGLTPTVARNSLSFSTLFSVSAAATQGDNLVVATILGNAPLGLYSRAYRLMALPANALGDTVDTVLFPVILKSRNDVAAIVQGVGMATRLISRVILPIGATSVVIGPAIVGILLGPQWTDAGPAFQILATAMYFRIAGKPLAATLRGLGHQGLLTGIVGANAVTIVVAAIVGSRWGINGVAAGVSAALVIYFSLLTFAYSRVVGQRPRLLLMNAAQGLPAAILGGTLAWSAGAVLGGTESIAQAALCGVAGVAPALLSFLRPGPRKDIRRLAALRRGPVP